MTLERQTISIPVGGTMSQAEAAPYVRGNVLSENVRYDKRGLASKRRPAAEVASSADTGLVNAVFDVSGNPWIAGPGGAARLDDLEDAITRSNVTEPRHSSTRVTPILRGRLIAQNPSVAVVGNLMCVVWTDTDVPDFAPDFIDTTSEVWCAWYDVSGTAARIVSGPSQVSGYVRSAHVVALDTGSTDACFILIGETSASAMRWDRYVVSAGTYAWSGGAAFAIGRISSNTAYDVCGSTAFGGYSGTLRAYAVWAEAAGTRLYSVDAAGTVVGATTTGSGRDDGCAIYHDPVGDHVYVGQRDGRIWSAAPSTLVPDGGYSTTVTLPVDLNVTRVALGAADGSGGVLAAYSGRELVGYGGLGVPVIWGTAVWRVNSGSFYTFVPNVAVIGKPLRFNATSDTRTFLPVQGFASQRGYLLSFDDIGDQLVEGDWPCAEHASMSSALECKFNYLDASDNLLDGPISNWTIPLVQDSDGDMHFVYPVVTQLATYDPDQVAMMQIDHARIRSTLLAPNRVTKASDVAIVASGAGAVCYDSQLVTQLCPQRPDPPTNTGKFGDAIAGYTSVNADTYYFSVIWGWFDAQGREHRSAESEQTSAIWTGIGNVSGSDWIPFLWACPIPMPLALYGLETRSFYLDVIQSAANDATDRRVIGRLWNPNVDSDFPDSVIFQPVQIITTSALLPRTVVQIVRDFDATTVPYVEPYTVSELEAVAVSGLVDIVSTQQRLWALSAENRSSVLVTKPITPTVTPEFADELSIDVPQEGGDCVALGALDDKIIVFKTSRIYVIVGDPGDATGERSSVQRPRLLSSDVGATNAAGVVEGPFGIAFQSLRGPMLLTRGMELQPIGEAVKDLASNLHAVGSLVPSQQEVRWYLYADRDGERWTTQNSAVVWQYERNEWASWTDLSVLAESANGASIWQAWGTASLYLENDAPDWALGGYNNSVTSPWIQLGNVEGYVRAWRVAILGYYYTGHVNVSVAYDYDDAIAETHVFLESVCSTLVAANDRIEISIRPERQKCSAIQITIEGQAVPGQDPPYPTVGEGLSVISADLEIGVKSGTARRRLAAEAKR
jgi:hypothetical protein